MPEGSDIKISIYRESLCTIHIIVPTSTIEVIANRESLCCSLLSLSFDRPIETMKLSLANVLLLAGFGGGGGGRKFAAAQSGVEYVRQVSNVGGAEVITDIQSPRDGTGRLFVATRDVSALITVYVIFSRCIPRVVGLSACIVEASSSSELIAIQSEVLALCWYPLCFFFFQIFLLHNCN